MSSANYTRGVAILVALRQISGWKTRSQRPDRTL